jgi:hypothetical protein
VHPRGHVVLLLHGIRTKREWAHRARATPEGTMRAVPTRYDCLDVVRFLLPIRRVRQQPVQRIAALLRDELTRKPDRVSIVAHSFGTSSARCSNTTRISICTG